MKRDFVPRSRGEIENPDDQNTQLATTDGPGKRGTTSLGGYLEGTNRFPGTP